MKESKMVGVDVNEVARLINSLVVAVRMTENEQKVRWFERQNEITLELYRKHHITLSSVDQALKLERGEIITG